MILFKDVIIINKLNLPLLGLRNIKTAISVTICIIIFNIINRDNASFACIAAVFCMQDTVSNSINMGKNRILGTFLGGLIGIFLIYLSSIFPFLYTINSIMTGVGISLSIYILTILNEPESVAASCLVIIGIMISYDRQLNPYSYAIDRTIDTALGILIAILVNKYIHPPKEKHTKKSR